jgi:hypothetical protein
MTGVIGVAAGVVAGGTGVGVEQPLPQPLAPGEKCRSDIFFLFKIYQFFF